MTLCRRLLALAAALACACESTPDAEEPIRTGDEVTISADELEPVSRFFLETNRLVVADFIRVEMTPQFFEAKMGFTRDPRFVERKSWRDRQGNRVIQIRNVNREQVTNIDPNMLPRVYFGSGLQLRAFDTIRVVMINPKTRKRPVYMNVVAKNASGDARLWTSGRLQQERPTLNISMALIWSEVKERYVPRSHIG